MPTPRDGAAQTLAFPLLSRAQWTYPLRTLRRGREGSGDVPSSPQPPRPRPSSHTVILRTRSSISP